MLGVDAMDIYNNNMELLKEYRPQLNENIKAKLEEHGNKNEYNVEFLESREGSLYMQCEGVRFNSRYNPKEEAKRWVKQFEYKEYDPVIIMFGLGTGAFAFEMGELVKNNGYLFIYEPREEVFEKDLNNIDLSDIIVNEKVCIAVGEKMLNELYLWVCTMNTWANLDKLHVIEHPGYRSIFESDFKKFIGEINKAIISVNVEGNTEACFGNEYAYNVVKNLPYLIDSNYLYDFYNVFDEDMVGIVVAAGPSLDDNIHVLHEMKNKALIIATDTSLKKLYAEGIEPDFAIAIDAQKPIEMFQNVGFEKLPFFCTLECSPEILKMHKGKNIWCNTHELHTVLCNRLGINSLSFNVGGSVATAAFSILERLGIHNIVLIGQDLAYKGDKTHADGKNDGVEDNISYVKGNKERLIKTRGDWAHYLRWYEREISLLPEDIRVINATEGGAYIEGTELMTLQEVADTLCPKDNNIKETIKKVLETDYSIYNNEIVEFIKECISDLEYMVKSIEKAITMCNKAERKFTKAHVLNKEVINILSDISKINEKLMGKVVYFLLDYIVKHEDRKSIKDIQTVDDDEYISNLNMIKNTKRIFKLSLEAAKGLIPEFENSLSEFERRMK